MAESDQDMLKKMFPDAPPTARSIDCFSIMSDMSMADIVSKCGRPDKDIGSGVYIFVYQLDDGSTVNISTSDRKKIFSATHNVSGKSISLLSQEN